MTGPAMMAGMARIAAAFDLPGFAASGSALTSDALKWGGKAAVAFASGFQKEQKKGEGYMETAMTRAMKIGFQNLERMSAVSGQAVADNFLAGINAVRSGDPGQSFSAATNAMTSMIGVAGQAGQALVQVGESMERFGPVFEMAGTGISIATTAMQTFTDTGGQYLATIAEIGDTYLQLRRTLAASTLDMGQVNAQMALTQEIMASGAVDHFDDVSQSIGRFARGLNLSGPPLREFVETYASMAELIGSVSPTNIAGVLNAYMPPDGIVAATGEVYEYGEQLTRFTNIIRATGGNAQAMVDSMIRVGPAMRALGYDAGGTALFFGSLIEKGLRGQKLVYGMNQIVEKLHESVRSKKFQSLEEGWSGLLETVKAFQAAGDKAGAIRLLSDFTTPANAALLNEAIANGVIYDAKEMGKRAGDGFGQSLSEQAAETSSLSDIFENLQQQFEAAISPVGLAFDSFIVSGGNKLVAWLAENQLEVAAWAKNVAGFFLDGFKAILNGTGQFLIGFSEVVNGLVEGLGIAMMRMLDIFRLPADFLGKLDWLPGNEMFKAFGDGLNAVNDAIGKARDADLSKPFREAGVWVVDLSGKLTKVKDAMTMSMADFERTLVVEQALKVPEVDKQGNLVLNALGNPDFQNAYGPVEAYQKDEKGQIKTGPDGEKLLNDIWSPMLQLMPGTTDKVRQQLRALNLEIALDATGTVITNVRALTEEARRAWEAWITTRTKTQLEVQAEFTADGTPIDTVGDALEGGSVDVTANLVPDRATLEAFAAKSGIPIPAGIYGTPTGPSSPSGPTGTLPSGVNRPAILNDQEGVQSSAASIYAAAAVAQNFPEVTAIGGGRRSGTAANTHDIGQSIDVAIPYKNGQLDMAAGDRIHQYLRSNLEALNIDYTIWRNKGVYANGTPFQKEAPGHMDHIDVHFKDGGVAQIRPGGTTVTAPVNTPIPVPSAPPGTYGPAPVAPVAPGAATAAPASGGIQGWLYQQLMANGLSNDQALGILAMNSVEGGAADPKSLLGFTESQAPGPEAHVAAFMRQWNDMSRRGPGGVIPGMTADGKVTDWNAYLEWIRVKIVGQVGVESDWQGNAQPDPQEYQNRLVQALQSGGNYQPWSAAAWPAGTTPAFIPQPQVPAAAPPIPVATPQPVMPAAPAIPAGPPPPAAPWSPPPVAAPPPSTAPIPAAPAPPAGPGGPIPNAPVEDGWKPDATGYYLYYQDKRGTTFFADKSAGAVPVPKNGVPLDTDAGHWVLQDHGTGGQKYWLFLPNPVSAEDSPEGGPVGSPPAPAGPPKKEAPKGGTASATATTGKGAKGTLGSKDLPTSVTIWPTVDPKNFPTAGPPGSRPPTPHTPEGDEYQGKIDRAMAQSERDRSTFWGKAGDYLNFVPEVTKAAKDIFGAVKDSFVGGWLGEKLLGVKEEVQREKEQPIDPSLILIDPNEMPAKATGGPVWGAGTATSDSIPAWLSNGEFVQNAAAVQHYGTDFMHAINSRKFPRFNTGGLNDTSGSDLRNLLLPSGQDTQEWLRAQLSSRGLSPDQIRGVLAMNAVEGGVTDPRSILGLTDSQASGPQAKLDMFIGQQWNDMSRRPGGNIPGVDAQGNVTNWTDYMTWIRSSIVGQNGVPSDWQGNAQPPAADYQNRLIGSLFGGSQRPPGFSRGGIVGFDDGGPADISTMPGFKDLQKQMLKDAFAGRGPSADKVAAADMAEWISLQGVVGSDLFRNSNAMPRYSEGGQVGGKQPGFAPGGEVFPADKVDADMGGSGDQFGYTNWGKNWEQYWRWVKKTGAPYGKEPGVGNRSSLPPLRLIQWLLEKTNIGNWGSREPGFADGGEVSGFPTGVTPTDSEQQRLLRAAFASSGEPAPKEQGLLDKVLGFPQQALAAAAYAKQQAAQIPGGIFDVAKGAVGSILELLPDTDALLDGSEAEKSAEKSRLTQTYKGLATGLIGLLPDMDALLDGSESESAAERDRLGKTYSEIGNSLINREAIKQGRYGEAFGTIFANAAAAVGLPGAAGKSILAAGLPKAGLRASMPKVPISGVDLRTIGANDKALKLGGDSFTEPPGSLSGTATFLDAIRARLDFEPFKLSDDQIAPLADLPTGTRDEMIHITETLLGGARGKIGARLPAAKFKGFNVFGDIGAPIDGREYANYDPETGIISVNKAYFGGLGGDGYLTDRLLKDARTGWGPGMGGDLSAAGQVTAHEVIHSIQQRSNFTTPHIEYALRNAFVANNPGLGLQRLGGLLETTSTGGYPFPPAVENLFRNWVADDVFDYGLKNEFYGVPDGVIRDISMPFYEGISSIELPATAAEDVIANMGSARASSRAVYVEFKEMLGLAGLPDLDAYATKRADIAMPQSRDTIAVLDNLARARGDLSGPSARKGSEEVWRPYGTGGPRPKIPLDFGTPKIEVKSPSPTAEQVRRLIGYDFKPLPESTYNELTPDQLAELQRMFQSAQGLTNREASRIASEVWPFTADFGPLSPDQINAAQMYTNVEFPFGDLNIASRYDTPNDAARNAYYSSQIQDLLSAIDQSPRVPAGGMVVTRAAGDSWRQGMSPTDTTGSRYVSPAFQSTSPGIGDVTPWFRETMKRIFLPEGTRALYVSTPNEGLPVLGDRMAYGNAAMIPGTNDPMGTISTYPNQNELILPPFTGLSVVADRTYKSVDEYLEAMADELGVPYDDPAVYTTRRSLLGSPGGGQVRAVDMVADQPEVTPDDWFAHLLKMSQMPSNYGMGAGVPPFAAGGSVIGPGSGASDSIPAWLSNGEFVQNAAAVGYYGTDFMHAVNSMKLPKFAPGGQVGDDSPVPPEAWYGSVPMGSRGMVGGDEPLPYELANYRGQYNSGATSPYQATDPKNNPFMTMPRLPYEEAAKYIQKYVQWQDEQYEIWVLRPKELADGLEKYQTSTAKAYGELAEADRLLTAELNLQATELARPGANKTLIESNHADEIKRLRDLRAVKQTAYDNEKKNLDDKVADTSALAADQRASMLEGPPSLDSKKAAGRSDKDAESLGAGLVKGVLQGLGFPDVFGDAVTEWGIYKMGMGVLGYGMNLANNAGLLPGSQTPGVNSGLGPGTTQGVASGLTQSLIPGVKDIPGANTGANVPDVTPSASVTPAMSAAATAGPGPVGTGPLPGPAPQVNVTTNVNALPNSQWPSTVTAAVANGAAGPLAPAFVPHSGG